MSVTDGDTSTSAAVMSCNELAEYEARMDAILKAAGVDTSDEAKAQRRREWKALEDARTCGKCGEPIGNDYTIYRYTYSERGMFGGTANKMRIRCEDCAPKHMRKYKGKMERFYSLRWYYPLRSCLTCGRTMVLHLSEA